MNNATKIALAKLLAKEVDGLDLPVGNVEVDKVVTLHVKAGITRRKDGEYTPTVSVPLKATMALLLARMGFQRDVASKLLVEVMTEALKADKLADEGIVNLLADVDAAMEMVQEITDALPKERRKGATVVSGSVEVVAEVAEVGLRAA